MASEREYILAGNYELLDRLYKRMAKLERALKQITRHTVNGKPSLAASVARGVLAEK